MTRKYSISERRRGLRQRMWYLLVVSGNSHGVDEELCIWG